MAHIIRQSSKAQTSAVSHICQRAKHQCNTKAFCAPMAIIRLEDRAAPLRIAESVLGMLEILKLDRHPKLGTLLGNSRITAG